MKRIQSIVTVTFFFGVSAHAAVASADALPFFSSGVDATDAVLAAGTKDPHYTLSAPLELDPTLAGPASYVVDQGAYPLNGIWFADDANSKWIGPQAANGSSAASVTFTYTQTVDLTNYDFTKAQITGNWACDDGSSIWLNGLPTANTCNSFSSLTAFSLATGFVAGTNTIAFVVNNSGGGPTGVRVTVTSATAPFFCESDTACTTAADPRCDLTSGHCVACLSSLDCSSTTAPICTADACAPCNGDFASGATSACPIGAPVCDGSGACTDQRNGDAGAADGGASDAGIASDGGAVSRDGGIASDAGIATDAGNTGDSGSSGGDGGLNGGGDGGGAHANDADEGDLEGGGCSVGASDSSSGYDGATIAFSLLAALALSRRRNKRI